MSRRKQPVPRHIETEDELATILQNGENSQSPTASPGGDAHVCGKCREEFPDLATFLAHKKACSHKRVVVFFDANDRDNSQSDNQLERSSKIPRMSKVSDVTVRDGSDGETHMDQSEEEEEEEDQTETFVDEMDEDDGIMEDTYLNGEVSDEDDLDDIDEINDKENDYGKLSSESKSDLSLQLPQFMLPFSSFLPSNNNVTLEPINATKAAVAQFAENNLPPSDLAMLHTTLYSLQQQQLVQLQLIQQLQQQLLMGMSSSSPLPNGHLSLLTPPASSATYPLKELTSCIQSAGLPEITSGEKSSTISTKPTSSESTSRVSSSSTTTLSLSTKPIPSSQPLPSNDAVSKATVVPETSDFARLSMWERPFKCNICGNRFSTRGNLKVHFERHKAKYPHVKMNPNPVPEHLDKAPQMPLLGSPFHSITTPPPLPMSSSIHGSLHIPLPPPITSVAPAPLPPTAHSRPRSESKSSEDKKPLPSPKQSPSSVVSTTPSSVVSDHSAGKKSPIIETSKAVSSVSMSALLPPSLPISSSSLGHIDSQHKPISSPFMLAPSTSHMPPIMSHPLLSPLSSMHHSLPPPPPPPLMSAVPFGQPSGRDSILPAKMIDHDESLEQYMEINRSETSKLQQLVDNLENKVSDPNQCVICHRVLSCKSALQMHYRIHTGERPFKCKICGRAFTTKGNLKTHMGVHRMKPPLRMMHQCPVCHKSFTNLLVLQQHIRSHAGMQGLHPMPHMEPMRMFPDMHPPMPSWAPRPFDLSIKPDPEKELDLSKAKVSGSGGHHKDELDSGDEVNRDDYMDNDSFDDMDDCDIEEDMELEEDRERMKKELDEDGEEETNHNLALNNSGKHKFDQENDKSRKESLKRPASAMSDGSQDLERSLSPKYISRSPQMAPDMAIFSSFGSTSTAPVFNSSLAALEERVRAIDASMAQSPLHHFRPISHMNGLPMSLPNGDTSPTSPNHQYESGSEGHSGEDGSKPGTPALSVTSDGGSSIGSGSGFMMDANDHRRTSTTCNICMKTFACRSALEIHYRSHTKERPFKCNCCDRSFSTRGNMRQHMLTHKIRDLPKSFKENGDSKMSENNNSLDAPDMEQGKTSQEFSSNRSDSSITSGSSGNHHTSTTSPTSTTNNTTSSRDGDNSPFVREAPLKHQCQVCQKGFSSASALQIHIRTHTGDKPFKCNVCGKAFTTKGNLKVHMGTHMWNNSPSRRGRRMSIEPPFMMAHKDNPYLAGFPHRSPDFFPYQFPPFMGVTPPKMNEISVIQNLAGGLGHMPPMSLAQEMTSPRSSSNSVSKPTDSFSNGKSDWKHKSSSEGRNTDSRSSASSSGELDLSMKSSRSSPSPPNTSSLPDKVSSWSSKSYHSSPSPIDHHSQPFHLKGESAHKGVVA
ncbi:sal-like protein 3 isoform X2 [Mizuhopecten yessoensis]|uniref:Sal-like protein 3 n=1 Tax=Mizuhopecten yessoensis TaxID=6573 RepID=A0A210PN32_MIZYE|nr:sal-like protein 3 isoform X2 [Mizuhopecten yessoensis]OWF37915.1 Sal-like protein 3 [Mizuhopecten yessoensis]